MRTIVLTSNVLWSLTQFRSDLIRALSRRFNVHCVADEDAFSQQNRRIIEEAGATFHHVAIKRKGLNPLTDLLYLLRVLKTYRAIKPDLIMHYSIKPNIYGSIAARLLGIPTFAMVTGLGSAFLNHPMLATLVKRLYRFALAKNARVLFLNRDDMAFFTAHKLIKPQQAFLLPGEGIDTSAYLPAPKNDKNSPVTFLMVARLLKDKGVMEYVECARTLKNARFLLAGAVDRGNPSAIAETQLQGWIEEGVVRYLGTTEHIGQFFTLCDVVVLPSYREGLSRVLLEACSCEKFIITTDIPGCRELCIEGENGLLCEKADGASLADAMSKAIALGVDALALKGKAGRPLVETTYATQQVLDAYDALIAEVLP